MRVDMLLRQRNQKLIFWKILLSFIYMEAQKSSNSSLFFSVIFTKSRKKSSAFWSWVCIKQSKSIFSLNFQTSCLTKAEEPSLPYYLPIAGGRIIGFISFPRVLVLCKMQSVSSRIWTRVAVSISYDDNHYTMGTSTNNNPIKTNN